MDLKKDMNRSNNIILESSIYWTFGVSSSFIHQKAITFMDWFGLGLEGMDEITSGPIGAIALLQKRMTWFGFVGNVVLRIALEFLSSVCKLAFVSIKTKSLFHEVPAQWALQFWIFLGRIWRQPHHLLIVELCLSFIHQLIEGGKGNPWHPINCLYHQILVFL